jgi:tryptophan synthase alpha chain
MSTRLATRFESLKAQNKKALIPYIVAGDPEISMTEDFMHALVESGASVIELGMPFSDPMADGPSNQLGHERALKNKISLDDVLQLVKNFREKDQETPVVLMGYLNPIEVYGYERFSQAAGKAGVDALLIVDLPPEEAADLKAEARKQNIDLIFLIAPTTTKERIALISSQASGFLYYVSLKGVTGAGHLDIDAVEKKLADIREVSKLPVNVGFGIKDGKSAAQLAKLADGVVVGSKLVDQCALEEKEKISSELTGILSEMRTAIDLAG